MALDKTKVVYQIYPKSYRDTKEMNRDFEDD